MSAREEGPPLLRELSEEGLPFVLIGSLGLALTEPALLVSAPGDVDLLVPFELPVLERFVIALEQRGFAWRSWQDPLVRPLSRAQLSGRFYLRARAPSGLVVDLTYESPHLPFGEAEEAATREPGFPVAALPHLLRLFGARGSDTDRALLRRAARGPRRRRVPG